MLSSTFHPVACGQSRESRNCAASFCDNSLIIQPHLSDKFFLSTLSKYITVEHLEGILKPLQSYYNIKFINCKLTISDLSILTKEPQNIRKIYPKEFRYGVN